MQEELIETLWNVNISRNDFYGHRKCELIETLWNVNDKIKEKVREVLTGINRNIVECKYLFHIRQYYLLHELIETLWNVNKAIKDHVDDEDKN